MKIKNLGDINRQNVDDLFICCFKNDPYYVSQYGDKTEEVVRGLFVPTIHKYIDLGDSYGLVDDEDDLVALLVCFKYKQVKAHNKLLFKELFSDVETGEIPYTEQIHDKLDGMNGDILFCVSIAVLPEYRRKGYASSLIEHVMNKYHEFTIVSDVSNKESLPIYERRGFEVTIIDEFGNDEGYYLVVHHKN